MLAAALHAFATHGYEAVSLRSLAGELGVSHNLLSQRYGSKARLWYACADWGFGGILGKLNPIVDSAVSDTQRLRDFLYTFALFSAYNPDLTGLVNAESSTSSERLDYLCANYIRPTVARFAPLYARAVERNELRAVPVETLFYMITSGTTAMYTSRALTEQIFGPARLHPDRFEENARAVADLLFDGLRPVP
ncbi:MAG: putative transcriptional regulator, TetR [Nocardia sp.]|nr:putative transcriptional regulator, TetR [Nocardia sp.]